MVVRPFSWIAFGALALTTGSAWATPSLGRGSVVTPNTAQIRVGARLRNAPYVNAPLVGTFPVGRRVSVINVQGNWGEVEAGLYADVHPEYVDHDQSPARTRTSVNVRDRPSRQGRVTGGFPPRSRIYLRQGGRNYNENDRWAMVRAFVHVNMVTVVEGPGRDARPSRAEREQAEDARRDRDPDRGDRLPPGIGGTAIVSASGLNVRKGPGTSHRVVAGLTQGDRVRIGEERGNWTQILGADGPVGWVFSRHLERDAEAPHVEENGSTSASTVRLFRGNYSVTLSGLQTPPGFRVQLSLRTTLGGPRLIWVVVGPGGQILQARSPIATQQSGGDLFVRAQRFRPSDYARGQQNAYDELRQAADRAGIRSRNTLMATYFSVPQRIELRLTSTGRLEGVVLLGASHWVRSDAGVPVDISGRIAGSQAPAPRPRQEPVAGRDDQSERGGGRQGGGVTLDEEELPTRAPDSASRARLSQEDRMLLQRLALAEARGEGTMGMAAVVRSVLNRVSMVRQGVVPPSTYLARGSSIRAIVYARNQYEPVRNGSLNAFRTADQLAQAGRALEIALSTATLRSNLEAAGLSGAALQRVLSATGFRALSAFHDSSQNHQVQRFKNHNFNGDRFSRNVDVVRLFERTFGG